MTSINIVGSHGDLTVDTETGSILSRNPEEAYAEIEKFDPKTLTQENMDILECGFWSTKGVYEPPEPSFVAHIESIERGEGGLL